MANKFEFDCDAPGCDRHIEVEIVDNPSLGDLARVRQEAHEAFSRRVRAHMSTHTHTKYGGAVIPPGQRIKGPGED